MKLTENIKAQADKIYNINEVEKFPFFIQKIAIAMVNQHGFYSFNYESDKILIVK